MTSPKPGAQLPWDMFVQRCTPERWDVRIRRVDVGGGVATSLRFPEDREIENAIARAGHPSGRYTCSARFRGTKGESFDREHKLLFIGRNGSRYKRIGAGTVELTPDHAAAPREARKPAGGVASALDDANKAEAEARAAQARAEAARARSEQRKHESPDDDLRGMVKELIATIAKPAAPDLMATVLPLLMQQQQTMLQLVMDRAAEDRKAMLAVIQEMREDSAAAPAAVAPDPMLALTSQMAMLKEVFGLVDAMRPAGDEARPREREGSWIERIAGQVIEAKLGQGALPAMPMAPGHNGSNGAGHQAAIAAPPAMPSVQEQAASAARERVQGFAGIIVREVLAGSSPEAVVDRLDNEGLFDLLPQAIREPLEAGSWDSAWTECRRINPALAEQLGPHLQTDEARAWLATFAAACVPQPEDEE